VRALRDLDEQAENNARAQGENGEEGQVERLREAFPRTGEEVRVLLS